MATTAKQTNGGAEFGAIGYVRVSTDEQASSGLGLAEQRSRIGSYAEMRGLRLIDVIDDPGVSGGRPLGSRPGGARLLHALQTRRAAHVVMLKLDRGFRNAADCLATVEAWDRRKVTLHIIDLGGNAIDTASAAGKFMLTVLAGAAEMERNLTRERTRGAMRIKRQRGQRISRFAPYGYRLDEQGELVAVADEQNAVQQMHEMQSDGKSLRQIAAALTSVGHRSRSGGLISPKTVRAVLNRGVLPTRGIVAHFNGLQSPNSDGSTLRQRSAMVEPSARVAE